MSIRSVTRSIARARLKAMGVPHVNKVMGLGMSVKKNRKLQKTYTGRLLLDKIREKSIPLWRRVTAGDLSKDGYRAQMGIGKRRKYKVVQ